MNSRLSLSDSKYPQVSRTLLSILTDFNNAVVWIVSNHPLISKSSSPCNSLFVTVPIAPITISITITLIVFQFSFKILVFISLFSPSFLFYLVVSPNGKIQYLAGSVFFLVFIFLIIIRSGRLAEIRWSICIIIIIIIIIIIFSFRVFHISVSWWFFTGVWVTASLLKSPGLVLRFWAFLAVLSFG